MFINLHVLTWDSLTTWQIIIQLRHSTAIREKKGKREKKQSILAFPSHHLLLPVYDRSARGERQYWCEENGDDRQDQEKKMM